MTPEDVDVETVRAALRLCNERRNSSNQRILDWPDFRQTNAAVRNLLSRLRTAEADRDAWRLGEARALAELQSVGLERNALHAENARCREALEHVGQHVKHYPRQPLDKGCRDIIRAALSVAAPERSEYR